ncbi:putative transcriptional regulator [Candidatus Methanoperedens nitroreducens]|uniref:Putative transcriptional regulator n=1 Tax=Candidatus Methanoperedens nitratireducens TaxID=1392998 RepID=A0A062V8I6_9EURY|nr:CBS domain-containing protein [Candidatus Methanoperedens nitroreducens]KCZ73607.1 putative transcriptional regulator [Candidatus Methanoperedens nitroreducens]MDJ1422431.1 CBS domain-containing protein [Candidatus Methanoperedens sp.]
MRLEHKLLRDVMTRGVVTVPMDATVKQIAAMLSKQGLSGVAVIGPDCEAMGIISDMDILKVIGKENWENIPAESIMSSHMETIRPTCTLGEAAKIMNEKNIHRLLIFSERGVGASQRPIGILSVSDIVREAARE